MDPATILIVVQGIMGMVRRHAAEHDGDILTDAQVHAALLAELADGQSTIGEWFRDKGLPIPE